MVLRVAVLAFTVDRIERLRISRISRVSGQVRMALLAQAGTRDLQQEVVDRAVRIVAVQAVLANGRMLPQERPALLRVTLVAIVVDGGFLEQSLRVAAVRVVAG